MKRLLVFLIVFPAIILSCQKDYFEVNSMIDDLELKSGDRNTGGNLCFELQFPVTVIMPDRSLLSGDSREELGNALKEWHRTHRMDKKVRINFQYPITVNFKGKILTLTNEKQLKRVREACAAGKGVGDKKICFEFVFPLSFYMPDRSVITVNTAKDKEAVFKRWYNQHPRLSDQKPVMKFPIKIKYTTDRGDRIVDIRGPEALRKAYQDCGN